MMNALARLRFTLRRTWRGLWLAVALLAALVAAFGSAPAQAAITISNTGTAPVFYTDAGNSGLALTCNYLAFSITSTTAVTDLWATIGSFTGTPTYLSLGGGEDGLFHVGALSANIPKYAFFYVCSSLTGGGTAASQGYTINTFDRDPNLSGAVNLGSQIFSTSIDDGVITAAANKVTVVVIGPNPATLGGIMTITVEGDTGTIGNAPGPNGPLSYTPASHAAWAANAYELYGTSIQFTVGNSGVFDNQLYFASLTGGANTHYIATYYFRAVRATSAPTSVSPIGHIASGTQIKHTDTGGFSSLQPVTPASNTILVAKSVDTATVPAQGGVVGYTVTVSNSGGYAINLDQIQDTLPTGASYVANSSSFNGVAIPGPTVNGQLLAWAYPFQVPAFSSRALIFQANLPATAGVYVNNVVAKISSTQFDTTYDTTDNAPATATTRVLQALSAAKSFAPASGDANTLSTLTITLTNNNTTSTLTGVSISDTYPASVVNAAITSYATTCPSATLTGGSPGGSTIGLTGASLAAGASCVVSISVTASTAGAFVNTTSAPSSANGGSGGTASATYYVPSTPMVSKSFSPSTIAFGATSTLSLQVNNSSPVNNLTGVSFSDTFPAGLQVAATPGLGNTCGGTATATAGSTVVSLFGGSVALSSSCVITLAVTATTAGSYVNAASGITSVQTGGPGPVSNSATLRVIAPPIVAKVFSPATIAINNGTSTLTITLTNTNPVDLTGAAFTDTYPANLFNTSTPAGATSCSGGTVTAVAAAASVSLSGATIPALASCTVTVQVRATIVTGLRTNTIGAGAVSTANGGANPSAVTAGLTVNALMSVTKAFAVDTAIASATYGITTMTIVITNNSGASASGLSFTDTFPANLQIATTPTAVNGCTGSFQSSADNAIWGAVTAGHRYIRLTGAAIGIAGGSCTLTVRVVTTAGGGIYSNQTSGVTSTTPAGTGAASNIARLTPPVLSKAFLPTTIGTGKVSTMTFTVLNVDPAQALSNLSFIDAYPAGIDSGGLATAKFVNATPVSFTNTCGGTMQSSADGTTWGAMTAAHTYFRITGVSVATGGSCTVAIAVTATAEASYPNITGKVVTTQGVGATASDVLYVEVLPTVGKAFTPATILFGAASTMSFVVTNNFGNTVTGLAFSDTFPAGMQIAATPAAANTCTATMESSNNGSTWGAVTAGHTYFRMRAAAVVASLATCTATVRVTTTAEGTFDNQSSGAFYTSNGGSGGQPNVAGPRSNIATLTVNLNPATPAKSFGASVVAAGSPVTLSVTITNPNARDLTGVSVLDTYPANLVNTTPAVTTNTCGGAVSAVAGGASFTLTGGTVASSGSCVIASRVMATVSGTYVNVITGGAVTAANAGANTATASAQVIATAPVTIVKAFSPISVQINTVASTGFTLTNPNPAALTGVAFSDNLPAGLVVAASPVPFSSCGGSLGATAGGTVIALSGGSIATSGTCTVSVAVTASAPGSYLNTASAVASNQTSAGLASNSVTLTVLAGGVFGAIYLDNNVNGTKDGTEDWSSGTTLYVKLATRSGATCANPATAVVTVNAGSGAYTFSGVSAGSYCLILDNNATLADTTHTLPAGWFTTIPSDGVWFITLGTSQAGGHNFGVINSSRISGRVFIDNGAGAGTANDGIQNGTEGGIAGVQVNLTNCAGTTHASNITASNGDYVFRVPTGAATLCVVESNLAQHFSTGANVGGTVLPSGTAVNVSGTSYTYTRPADSITFANAANTSYTGINFGDVLANSFAASAVKQAQPGNIVFYAHTYVAQTTGVVSFSASAVATPALTGWSEVIYRDTNCNGLLDAGESTIVTPATAIAMLAGESACLIVKEFVPDAAPYGAQNQVLLNAAFSYTNANPALSAAASLTDITQVTLGAVLRLRKEVCNVTTSTCVALSGSGFSVSNTGRPGDELQYRIVYTNASNASLTALVVNDTTPPFSVRAATPAAFAETPSGLGTGTITEPAAGAAGAVAWPFSGALLPGAGGSVTFNVTIQ